MPGTVPNICHHGNRCRCFRTCATCAGIRQAVAASMAERIEAAHGHLWLTVAKPDENTAEAIRALRARILRNTIAPAGLWSIETGEQFNGLHLNVLSAGGPLHKKLRSGTYAEALRLSARVAAAYILKPSGIPTRQQYTGRLYGTFGTIADQLAHPSIPALVQAAAIEQAISSNQKLEPISNVPKPYFSFVTEIEKTSAEFLAIAREHLPTLRQYLPPLLNQPARPATYPVSSIAS